MGLHAPGSDYITSSPGFLTSAFFSFELLDFDLNSTTSEANSFNMSEEEPFPWEIGVYDAHCHPTDTMASVVDIPHMKTTTLTIMATRGEDQDLVQHTAASLVGETSQSQTDRIVPCFGWHPWFSHQITDDTQATPNTRKTEHYAAVLTPSPTDDLTFLDTLPDPKPLSEFISETRARLQQFPNALVGEIGLDKTFRLPGPWTPEDIDSRDEQITPGSREGRRLTHYRVKPEHQRSILKAQLQLAGEMNRAVSLHSVQAHGAVIEVLKEVWAGHERVVLSRRKRDRQRDAEGAVSEDEEDEVPPSRPFPPRICMHSYSGSVDPIRQLIHKSNPSDIYFSFSSLINLNGAPARKVGDVVKALPEDRILIESDLHKAGAQLDELMEDVARQICKLRGWELRHGVQLLADNWRRFVFG
jgi:Tat protein secretion system quality control protein TatD with DNase activity